MATTYVDNGGAVNGSNKEYTFSFPYLKTEDVKVSLNGLTQATTKYAVTTSPTKITFNGTSVDSTVQESDGSPKTGVTVRVYRDTEVDSAKAVYASGSSVRAGDLNNNQDQILYALQEAQSDTVNTYRITNVAVTRDKIRADAIDGTKIADDSIDSEHYVAGSIDLEHMSANSVDSDQYVDGSVDLIHLSANSVDSSKIVDGSITNADISSSAAIDASKIVSATPSVAGTISSADKAKLDAIEAGATADQTNAEIRAAVEAATDSNVFTDADHSKLNAIEASATADQTGAEIKTAYEAESNTNAYTDAEKTKLAGIDTSADVTDATTVNAAGAVMNSDLDAKGEILVGDGSGDPTAFPASTTNGHILTIDTTEATGMKWAANAGAGGGGSSLIVLDESSTLTNDATKITFVGAGVTATEPSTDEITVTIPGTNTQLTEEQVEDFVGGMVTGNTETGITVTYDDSDGTLDFVVASQTDENFTTADHAKLDGIATSANNYAHPNHSGEVTSTADGATVIASDIVDEDNLKISNAGSNGQFLQKQSGNTGGLTWASVVGSITALNNQAANRLTTIGSTTTELDGEASLTFEDTTATGLISGKQITGRGFECPATVSDDWTIAAGNNAFFPGPMTVAANKTVTVPANRTLTIV